MNCIIETNAIYNDFFLSVRSQWTHNNYLCSIIVKIRRIDGRRFGSEASEMPHIEGSSPLLSILFTDVRMQVRVPAYSTHLQNLAWRGQPVCGHCPQSFSLNGYGLWPRRKQEIAMPVLKARLLQEMGAQEETWCWNRGVLRAVWAGSNPASWFPSHFKRKYGLMVASVAGLPQGSILQGSTPSPIRLLLAASSALNLVWWPAFFLEKMK